MATVKFYQLFLFILIITTVGIPAFEAGAYIPAYRLVFSPGAENTLGRPSFNPSPGAWAGQLKTSPNSELPESWYDKNWSLKLGRSFDAFYLHIPLGEKPDPRQIAYLKNLIQETPPRIYLSLIGETRDFISISGSNEKMKNLSRTLSSCIRDYHLDGIDIDWEFPATPREKEKTALTTLLSTLKQELPEGTVLSVALSRWRLPDQKLFDIADEIHLMAYDGYGRHATIESAISDSETILTRYSLATDKMILGIPFYGRIFKPESVNYWKGTKNYAEIVRDYSPGMNTDEADEYFYNGPSTVEEKTEWAKDRGLGGVFVWEPFYDTFGDTSLMEIIYQVKIMN